MIILSANVAHCMDVNKTPASVRGVCGYRPAAYAAWAGNAYEIDVRRYNAGTIDRAVTCTFSRFAES